MNPTTFIVAIFALIFLFAANAAGQTDNLKFDESLEKDFSSAMSGDEAAAKRAFDRAEKILAANPSDAETLVWHGSATLARSGQAFQNGNFKEGAALWQKGLEEMDSAANFAPDNFRVRIVRGSTLLGAAKRFPDPTVSKELREKGAADYEKLLSLPDENAKKAVQSQLVRILSGLADAYEKLGDKVKAETFRQRLAAQTSVNKTQ